MTPRSRRAAVGALLCLVSAAVAVAAWAFWTADGTGHAVATGGDLRPPVLAPPSVADGSVALAWSASLAPGPGTVDYWIERRAAGTDAWVAACSSGVTAPITATQCSDVPGGGSWEWRVVASFHTWTATSDVSDAVDVDAPDTTPPTGEVTAPASGAAVRATVAVASDSADADSGVASVRFQWSPHGAGTWTTIGVPDAAAPYSASWDTTAVADGPYDLRAITTDAVGNAFTSLVVDVRVDNTAPTVSMALAPAPTGASLTGGRVYFRANAGGSYRIVATVSDAGSGPAQAAFPVASAAGWSHAAETVTTPSGGPYTSSPFSWTPGASTPGTYAVTVRDGAGNSATGTLAFTADTTAPTGSVTAPAAGANVRGSAVSVTSSSADSGSGVASAQFQVSPAGLGAWSNLGAAVGTSPYTTSWNTTLLADRLYDLRVITTDGVGNVFTSTSVTNVRVDNTAPTGSISAPTTNAFVSGAAVAVTATAGDTGAGVASVQFQVSPRGAGTWTNLGAADTSSPYGATWNTTSGYPDGRYDVRAVVADKAGNTTTVATVPVEVQNAAPAVTALQLLDGGGTPGRAEPGDRIVVTYSETLAAATLCSAWSGNLTVQSLSASNDVTVTLADGGSAGDTVTVTSATCTLHLGTWALGATGYVSGGSRSFGGGGPNASTVVWDPTAGTLTVTLGKASGAGSVGTVGASVASLTPDPAVRNVVGTAVTGTFSTGSVAQF